MLQEDVRTPVLLFAMDGLDTSSIDTFGALSVAQSDVLQAEIAKKKEFVDRALTTDIYAYLSRVAIPINDRLLPIHYSGGGGSSSHFIDYLDKSAVLTKQANMINLSFELKNKLSALSTVSDLILGLADKDFFSSNEPRISFFSANLSVFNAYLRGINRSIVTDTDKEVLNFTLEVAPNRISIPVIEDKAKQTSNSLENTAGFIGPPAPTAQAIADYAEIEFDEIDFSYSWYEVFNTAQIQAIEVPDFQTDFTVEREELRLLRVESLDFNQALRSQITLEFKEIFTTLKSEDGQTLNEFYGMMMYRGRLYFGIKNAN